MRCRCEGKECSFPTIGRKTRSSASDPEDWKPPRSNISLSFGDLWADRDESFVPTNSHSTGQAEVSSAPADLQAENQYFPFVGLTSQRLNMTFRDADQTCDSDLALGMDLGKNYPDKSLIFR
jgi:hypothetical protein